MRQYVVSKRYDSPPRPAAWLNILITKAQGSTKAGGRRPGKPRGRPPSINTKKGHFLNHCLLTVYLQRLTLPEVPHASVSHKHRRCPTHHIRPGIPSQFQSATVKDKPHVKKPPMLQNCTKLNNNIDKFRQHKT